MEKIRVGLIGCGFMGAMHANCYNAIEGVDVVAVADVREENAKELAAITGAEVYPNADALIESARVDVINICLPTFLHAEYALKAMDKVKYLFVEKPVCLSAAEGDVLLEKQRKTGCSVQVGQVIRFWDEYVYLKKLIDEKTYGRVVNANFRRLSPRPAWGWNNWQLDAKLSGGAGLDLHIHDSDYLLYLFGRPSKISVIKNVIGEKNSYINCVCHYGDFVASMEGTWDLPASYPFGMFYRVVFENAVVELADGKVLIYDAEGCKPAVIDKPKLANVSVTGGNISDLGGYFNELNYFISVVANNGRIDKSTLEDAVNAAKFVFEELES